MKQQSASPFQHDVIDGIINKINAFAERTYTLREHDSCRTYYWADRLTGLPMTDQPTINYDIGFEKGVSLKREAAFIVGIYPSGPV